MRLLPVISLMMNSQESWASGYSPHELFLGRPAWFLHAPSPEDTHSSVGEWVQEQQAKVDKARGMLLRVRERQWNKKRFEVLRFDFAGTRRLSAPGATWSGQMISSPPGPSGGPSKTHLLPGGGVPRVHRARSPVPPLLPLLATPRSVHQFAAMAAGAYPLRRPPNAWSPGAPALLGPCYWLVASGTPLGWRGGCLA